MSLYDKFLKIQKEVDSVLKDGTNTSDKYDFVSGNAVLNIIRPKMNELGLLLIPSVRGTRLHEGSTKSGTARFVVEIDYDFTWVDVETGETLVIPWYANGSDLGSAERAVGKAATYSEKYVLLKFFHIPTDKDDPDNDNRTKNGELRQRGTAAAKETADFQRKAITQMLTELSGGDAEKFKAGLISMTKSDSRGYPGVDEVSRITPAALPVVYSKFCKTYAQRTGKEFVFREEVNE